MTESKGDEKYAKAAKQSQRNLLAVVAIVLMMLAALSCGIDFTSNGSKSTSSESSSAPLLKQKKSPLPGDENHASHKVIAPSSNFQPSIKELEDLVKRHDAAVRSIKAEVKWFEMDERAQAAAKILQDSTRTLLHKRYGPKEPYRVVVGLEFQDTMPDFAENGKDGSIVIELAPSSLQPHSIHTFLEVSRQWKEGSAFHRIAPHVLQVMVLQKSHDPEIKVKHLAFQEYSPEYPHKQRTVGYAGRPSGPAWYVSLIDNTRNHGPGSQQTQNPYEADSCFGTVIGGWEDSVLRMTKVPGKEFLSDVKKHVLISSVTIQVPSSRGDGTYVPWHDDEKEKRTAAS